MPQTTSTYTGDATLRVLSIYLSLSTYLKTYQKVTEFAANGFCFKLTAVTVMQNQRSGKTNRKNLSKYWPVKFAGFTSGDTEIHYRLP